MYHFYHLLFISIFVMIHRENNIIYLSITFDLDPWNPLITNMVSEDYGNSTFDLDYVKE